VLDTALSGGDGAQPPHSSSSKKRQQQTQVATAAGIAGSSLAGYAAQLILGLMEGIARRHLQVPPYFI